jgi:DNA-binding MarR family transcriptional regulator
MEEAISLLREYQRFTQHTGSNRLEDFADWIKQKHTASQPYQTDDNEVNEAGLDVMVSYLLGGLTGYTEAWIKLTFQELPLVSIVDFAILKTVEYHNKPSKKEIAEQVITERTTCIESIKRLVKEGLLAEEIDKTDKRMVRVKLTKAGIRMIDVLNEKMKSLGTLLVGDLDEAEKKSLVVMLNKLSRFHDRLYRNKSREEVKASFSL